MSKQEIHLKVIKPRKHPCDLCGKGQLGDGCLRVGGYVTYAHDECCSIGDEAIRRFFQLIIYHPNGTNILAEELLKARGAKFELNDLFKQPKETTSYKPEKIGVGE
jgi:hypothetical protein